MFDGIYQSAILWFMAYLLFGPANFVTENGRDIGDQRRIGVYVACCAIVVINTYILLNTYHWDTIMLPVTIVSILLIFAWTGIYTSFTGSFQFYKAGSEVYGTLTFWALSLLIVIVCLLPRFAVKFFQKNFRPYDIDIIREQVRQGKFKHLDAYEAYIPPKVVSDSGTTSDQPEDTPVDHKSSNQIHARYPSMAESQRPFYPPSEAPTRDTRHPHSQTGSDGTDRTKPSFEITSTYGQPTILEQDNPSFEQQREHRTRPSVDRVRSSFDRSRQSFDKLRPSFEGSRDFTSAAMLSRMESSNSHPGNPLTPTATHTRRRDIPSEF